MPMSQGDRRRLAAACSQSLYGLFGSLWRASAPAWLELDLTISQLKALMALRWRGPQSVGQLAAILRVSEPSASQLVERLVQRGLACRAADPHDRRRTVVSVTAAGDQFVGGLRASHDRTVEEWLAGLDDDELAMLAGGLAAVQTAAGAQAASCAPDVSRGQVSV
jgi:DNA-binding MarR family transcriptional regulator